MDKIQVPHIDIPDEYLELPVRENLRLGQTNVAASHADALAHLAAAYAMSRGSADDPTAAGEAAAKACLHTALLEGDFTPNARLWQTASLGALSGRSAATKRERIATYTNAGRARAFGLNNNRRRDPALFQETSRVFEAGETIIIEQHRRGNTWDPYATMHSKYHAIHEARNHATPKSIAAKIALGGIGYALRARQENANTPDIPRAKSLVKHAVFVGKQVAMNTLALGLALSRPKADTVLDELHRAGALKMLR